MKITLCGSARFEIQYHYWNKKLTLIGHIVYGLSTYPSVEGNKEWHGNDDRKILLDLMHYAKIEESDAIVVLNIGDYIGDSTRREILWAQCRHKLIYYLEQPKAPIRVRETGGMGDRIFLVQELL